MVYGVYETAESLLKLGANPNIQNRLGQTPLHQASENNQISFTKLLIYYKANPNIQQNDGDTPLHIACNKGYLEIVKILLLAHANPNIPNFLLGRTPLHSACLIGNIKIIESLLEFSANINEKDKNNLLPIDLASKCYVIDYIQQKLSENHKKTSILENELAKESIHEPESEKALPSITNRTIHSSAKDYSQSCLYNWLTSHQLSHIFENLYSNGFDDLEMLLETMQSSLPLTKEILKEIGISKIGDRLRLLSCLEDQFLTSRNSNCNGTKVFCCLKNIEKNKQEETISLRNWLKSLNLEHLYENFVNEGFFDLEQILKIMKSRFPITDEVLETDLGIEKIGYRERILARLMIETNSKSLKFVTRFDRAEKISACGSCDIN